MNPKWISCLTGILIVSLTLRSCHTEEVTERPKRAIDYPMQWRPVSVAPAGHAGHSSDHLISIASFDTANKAQLAQIAHHNAQILRHIKRVPGVPVTQYLNPFPMFTGAGVQTSASGGASMSSSSIVDHHPIGHSAVGSTGSGSGKHFIVQTSNVVIHPAPASTGTAITSAPLHSAHPNSLLTSSSNMAQTIVPFGHLHKHQYFVGAGKQPAFLLGKPSELTGGAFKFLNTIHPTSTGKNSFPGMLKGSVVGLHHQPSTSIFSSTTSRIPIIRDSTLAPLAFHRGSTSKPHPVVNKLQAHLALAQRAKPPTGPHHDELSAHQSHLISSLAQFAAAPSLIRAAEVAQSLPRPQQQGPAFAPLPDHFGTFFKNGFGTQMRFPTAVQPPPNTMSSVQFGHQQQLRQQFAQQQQQLHAQQQQHQQQLHAQHQQQIKELEHLKHQQKHQQQQQHSQHVPQHSKQQQHSQKQQHNQQQHNQQQHPQNQQQHNQHNSAQSNLQPQQPTQQLPSQQQNTQFNQQQHYPQQSQPQQLPSQHQDQHYQNSQQHSQHQENFYQPTPVSLNQTKFETSQSQDHHQNFELPFKHISSFGESSPSSTRSPQPYLPPLPSVAPSVLSPFFQQVQQQQLQQDLDEQQEHADQQRQTNQQQQLHEQEERRQERERMREQQQQQQFQHFYFSSTSAPAHQVEIRPSPPDDYIYSSPNHSAAYNHFQPDSISYHHQQFETHQQQQQPTYSPHPSIPPFNRIEDEFTLNLVPPPSYPRHKDTNLFRRPVQGTRGPPSTVLPTVDSEQLKAMEILNKYNIPAISPLQDANRFAYNSRPVLVSSAAPPIPSTVSQFHLEVPSPTPLTHFTTTKPNVFRQLNRPSESEYKQHKVMHPLYTGGPKRPGGAAVSFAAATTAPGRDTSAVTHSFFTIEDAVTLSPQIAQNNHFARPTSTGQIEANLNRPHEEEITEVITMRTTSGEDEELLQHLDATSPKPSSSARPKHRRRRPRPSSSTSTSTTEQVEDEEPTQKLQDESEPEQQGHWETNRFPSNHRETAAEPTVTTTKETPPIPPPRHRSRHRGRPSVNVVPVEAISNNERQPSRNRRPTPRPEESKPSNTRTRTTQTPPTTENYEEPVTLDLRDNIFLANLQQRRRPPHSTKSTVFAPSVQSTATTHSRPSTTASQEDRYERFNTRAVFTTTPSPPETETFMTTRGTRPAILTTNAYQNQQTNAIEQSTNQDVSLEPEEMTMASETISNTIVRLETTLPTDATTATTTKIASTSAQPNFITSAEAPEIYSVPNNRIRQRLRTKENYSNEITSSSVPSTSSTSTTQSDESPDEQPTENNELPDPTKYHPVSVRLPIVKDSTTTRTSTSDEPNSGHPSKTRQNAIAKFDPKNRPRFSVKDYRQRLTVSSTAVSSQSTSSSTEVPSTSPSTTTRSRYPTRSRVLPDLRIKAGTRTTSSQSYSEELPSTSSSNSVSSERDETEFTRKRFMPKERRPYSTPPSTSSEPNERPSRTTTTTTASPASGRSTRTRNPTSRRTFSSSTTPSSIESSVTRVPTIRKFPSISLRRPAQPSLRQRIAISQQKKTSTETPVTVDPSLGSAVTEPTNINKLFNLDDSELEEHSPMGLEEMDDESLSESTNTENYKLETAIMKIAKDDHSYRPYAHSTGAPRSRTRTTASPATTEPMTPMQVLDEEQTLQNQISDATVDDLNGSPSEYSERVAELTRFGANQFQSVNTASAASGTSRRVPGYFTIATEDPILPIEAFFPKMSAGNSSSNRGK